MSVRRVGIVVVVLGAAIWAWLAIAWASGHSTDAIIYVSSTSDGSVDGIDFKDEDILAYNTETDTWAMHFDGSDVGLNGDDINAFHILDDNNDSTDDPILVSMKNANPPGVSADDSDIVIFTPTSLGTNTAGSFALYFDGSDVGLTTNSEAVDAIARTPAGDLLISTNGSARVPGNVRANGEDLLRFTPTSLGDNTAGSFEVYFDGSDVGLTKSTENVWGTWVDDTTGDVYLTTKDQYSVPGFPVNPLAGDQEEIIVFTPTSLGAFTSGTFALYWNGDDHRFAGQRLDGFFIEFINKPPVLAAIGDKTVDELETLSFTATATDADLPPQTLTFSLDAAAISDGMSINPTTGAFTWTPTESQGPGVFSVTVTVTDDGVPSLSDFETISITVNEVNVAPVLDGIGNQSVDEEATLSFTASASDGDIPANGLTFSLDAAAISDGMSINSTTGAFTWTPTEAQGGASYSATVTVTDDGVNPANLTDFETISITVNEVNTAPVLDGIGNQSVDEEATLSFTASASDSDDPAQNLTFSLDAAAISDGMSINAATGAFSWTPTEAQGGASYSATVTVTDDGINPPNLTDFETISITVNEVNVAPVLAAIGNKSVDEEATLNFTASASDGDIPANGLTFSLDATAISDGMSINPTTGAFTWTPTESQGGASYNATITVTDDGINPPNLTDFETISITVNEVNVAPVLAAIGNKSVDEEATLSFTASATDSDDPAQSLTFSLDATAISDGMSINPTTGAFSWTPTESQGGASYNATITVTDDGVNPANLTDFETISITVNEVNVAPVLAAIGNKSVDEEATLSFTASATDSDDPAQSLTFSLDAAAISDGMSINPATGDFTWTPSESQGGASYNATITVTDDGVNPANLTDFETISITVNEVNTAPVITSAPVTTATEDQPYTYDVDATDSDLPPDTLTFSLDTAPSGMTINGVSGLIEWTPPTADIGSNPVTVRVTDDGVNPPNLFDTQSFSVLVSPANTPPVLDLDLDNSGGNSPDYAATFTEDGGPVNVTDSDLDITDAEDATMTAGTVTIMNAQDGAAEVLQLNLVSCAPISVVGNGSGSVTLSGSAPIATYEACLSSATYENTSQNPTAAPDRTIQLAVSDGIAGSVPRTTTVTVVPVNDPPNVSPTTLSYDVLGNVGITVPVANGLLSSLTITDPDYAGTFTIENIPATSGTLNVATNGSFTYDPSAGFAGSDDFTYDVCDNGSPLPKACTTVNVSVTVSDMIWFIDNNAAGAGNGTLQAPFNTLAAFEAVNGNGGPADPAAGDTVFIYSGVSGYTGGVTLENSQILIGQGATGSIASIAGITVPIHSNALPATSGSDPQLAGSGGGIVLASGNTVRGLDITTTSGTALAGASVGALSVSEVDTLSASGGRALDLSGGTAAMNVDIGSVTVTGSAVGGINLSNNPSSTTTLGSAAITTTGGTGFNTNDSGTVNIGGTASTISSTGGASLSAVNTTIGGGGWTFASISNDQGASGGDVPAITLTNTGSGTFTVNGGTIENITDADGIRLSNTDGLVTLANMVIEDIAGSTDATDGSSVPDSLSGVDGIHGQSVNGGLTLDNTTMRRFSDNAINGTLFSDGLSETNWNGLSILNSTIEDSNRYHVGGTGASGKGDSSDEGLVRIVGITGTVVIDNSTLQRGAELIDFFTGSGTGTLDMTVQSSNFIDSIKEFVCGNPTQNVGKAGIDVTVEGPHDAVIRIGDPAQTNPALGNTFTNNATASVRILHDAGTSGDIDAVISRNTFEVTDHLTGTNCAPGNFIFNFAQGGVLLGGGAGTFEAIVSNNLFDEVMNADGGFGQLTIVGDDGGDSEFIVTGNEFRLPWQAAVRVLADGNNSMAVRFGGPGAGEPNTYTDGTLPGLGDDLGGPFPSPFWPWTLNVRNGGALDITLDSEILPLHDVANSGQPHSFEASMNSSGGALNIHLENSKSPLGYSFVRSTPTCSPTPSCAVFNVYRDGSSSTGIQAILQDNGNTGGGGVDGTTPPDVVISGTVGYTDTAPTLPAITIS